MMATTAVAALSAFCQFLGKSPRAARALASASHLPRSSESLTVDLVISIHCRSCYYADQVQNKADQDGKGY